MSAHIVVGELAGAWCLNCGCTPANSTTDCPGLPIDPYLLRRVAAGKLDYIEPRGWVRPPPPASP